MSEGFLSVETCLMLRWISFKLYILWYINWYCSIIGSIDLRSKLKFCKVNGNNLASQCIVRAFKNSIFKHNVGNSLTFDWGIPRPVGRDRTQVWEKWDPRGCTPLLLSSKLTTPHVGVSSYLQNTHLFFRECEFGVSFDLEHTYLHILCQNGSS